MNKTKRQRVRLGLLAGSFLLFPITIFYFSPYLSVMGAFNGIVPGCLVAFGLQFLCSFVFRRAFCGWICPAGGLQEMEAQFAGTPCKSHKINVVKYVIWVPWVCSIATGAIIVGGFSRIDLLYQTDHGISVASLHALVIYLVIVALFFIPNLFLGRRAMCHCICWMAPFMVIGGKIGKLLRIPQLQVKVDVDKCVNCGLCARSCPMSLGVEDIVAGSCVEHAECIQCGACCDACNKGALRLTFGE